MPTAVIYRTYPDGDVVALFAEIPSSCSNPHLISCYAHLGQHGQADYGLVVEQTRPATGEESEPLHRELERIGYEALRPCQRRSPKMREKAAEEWRRAC